MLRAILAPTSCARVLCTAALGTVPLAAQDGPFLGTPHGLSVAPFSGLDEKLVYHKHPGLPPMQNTDKAVKCDSKVDYGLLPIPAGVDVDAVCIGLAWVPSTPTGVYQLANQPGWAALSFTVTPATVGTGVIATQAASNEGAAGDLFSYVFPGSALPAEIVDVVRLAQDSTQMKLWPPAQLSNRDLDAHDIYMALCALGPRFQPGYPTAPTFYFSISNATLPNAPQGWWAGSTPSGATVLQTTWNPTTQSWGSVTPFILYSQFPHAVNDDVDAFSFDSIQGYAVYSLASGLPSPVLFYNVQTQSSWIFRIPQTGGGTNPVANHLGLLASSDDVNGICVLDPGLPRQYVPGGELFAADHFLGQPFELTGGIEPAPLEPGVGQPLMAMAPPTVMGSVYAGRDHVGAILTGTPPGAGKFGVAVLDLSNHLAPSSFFTSDPILWRAGTPLTYQINVPLTQFVGSIVDVRWIVGNPLFTQTAVTKPVLIRM